MRLPGARNSRRPRRAGSPSASRTSTSATRRCASWPGAGGVHAELELSDRARAALLELYARALAGAGGPLRTPATARAEQVELVVRRTPGRSTCVEDPSGALELVDLTLEVV